MTQTAASQHAKIQAFADTAPSDTRDCSGICLGEWGRQGDVNISPIKSVPAAWNVAVTEHRQVAVGEGVGSHHIAEGDGLTVLWPKSKDDAVKECPIKGFVEKLGVGAEFCLGPVIVAEKPWTLTHPKHPWHQYPAGTYLVTYQLDRSTMRQVRD